MATLVLGTACPGPTRWALQPSLPDWLGDDWALVFSHPGDFAHEGFERDRWLRILRDAFRDRGVRAVALARGRHETQPGWIDEVTGDTTAFTLSATYESVAAGLLREQIDGLEGRFVLVVDAQLQAQAVLRYVHSYMQSLSPLELLDAVDGLRRRALPPGLRPAVRRDHITT